VSYGCCLFCLFLSRADRASSEAILSSTHAVTSHTSSDMTSPLRQTTPTLPKRETRNTRTYTKRARILYCMSLYSCEWTCTAQGGGHAMQWHMGIGSCLVRVRPCPKRMHDSHHTLHHCFEPKARWCSLLSSLHNCHTLVMHCVIAITHRVIAIFHDSSLRNRHNSLRNRHIP
jgi:hypothetical protein